MGYFSDLKADYSAYNLTLYKGIIGLATLHTFWLGSFYRLGHWAVCHRIPVIPAIMRALGIFFYSADIAPTAHIGPGFRVAHSVGIVVGPSCVIGSNFELFQNVTLGGRDRARDGRTMPLIGDNVTIFCGATCLGPIAIGDNASVGANSVVLKDVPTNAVVAGNPGKVISYTDTPHALRSQAAKR